MEAPDPSAAVPGPSSDFGPEAAPRAERGSVASAQSVPGIALDGPGAAKRTSQGVREKDLKATLRASQTLNIASGLSVEQISQLDRDERARLREALLMNNQIPEEQRRLVMDTVRPDGYADQLMWAYRAAQSARANAWLGAVLTVAELVFACVGNRVLPETSGCSAWLQCWLLFDSLFALAAVGATFLLVSRVTSVFKEIGDNPTGAAQRYHAAAGNDGNWQEGLGAVVPEIDLQTYLAWAGIAILCAACVLIGAIGALLALVVLLWKTLNGCIGITGGISAAVVMVRLGTAWFVLSIWLYIRGEILTHNDMQGWEEGDASYGATDKRGEALA